MKLALAIVAGGVSLSASAQGTFQNLDFEDATIAPTPVGGDTYPADPSQAFPYWTVGGLGAGVGYSGTVVGYNGLSLGAPAVNLMGPNLPNAAGYTPLQGSYSVLMQYFNMGRGFVPPTLSQTGMIPTGAQSINFLVSPSGDNAVVEVNGETVPLIPIAGGRLAGDISAWSGQTMQLTFTTPNTSSPTYEGDWFYFDDICFSSVPFALLPVITPQLTIALSGVNVVLTWPTNAIGFGVQSTTNLVSPADWSSVSSGPILVTNGQNTVTTPISGSPQFYRLSYIAANSWPTIKTGGIPHFKSFSN